MMNNMSNDLKNEFPIGVKYFTYPHPLPKYWEEDIKKIKDAGFDNIRINAFWSTIQVEENKFDFDMYDQLLEIAGNHGIKVLMTSYLTNAPEWMFEKYPDSKFVSSSGRVWDSENNADAPAGGWPGVCFDNPAILLEAEKFIKALMEHYQQNRTLMAIDVMHEPHDEPAQLYYPRDWREMCYCYCPHTIEGFRTWLKNKYTSLDQLNTIWHRRYSTWEQVFPPKHIAVFTDWLDWKNYRIESLTGYVQWISDTVKKYNPEMTTVTHCPILEISHPITSSNDHFELAKAVDILGCSMYDTLNPELSGVSCDLLRSSCDNGVYWIAETSGGSGPMFPFIGEKVEDYFPFSLPMTPEALTRQTWGSVARGAKGLIYWTWRPELATFETAAMGFTERNGDITERVDAITNVSKVISENKDMIVHARAPKSRAAIFYHLDTVIQEGLVSMCKSTSAAVKYNKPYFKDFISIYGLYKLCMKNNIQVDFINKEKVMNDELEKYETLFMPYSINITDEIGEKISHYVFNGGNIITEAMCGYFTNLGWGSEVCPGGGLDKVFGCTVKSNYDIVNHCDINMHLGEKNYHNIGNMIKERLVTSSNAEIMGSFGDGSAAVIKTAYGKGKAIYVGSLVFGTAIWNYSGAINRFFNDILDLVDFKRDIRVENVADEDIIEVRYLEKNDSKLVFIINHSQKTLTPKITMNAEDIGHVTDLLCGNRIESITTENNSIIELVLKPSQVVIFKH